MALAGARRGALAWGPLRFDELERTTAGALADTDRPLGVRGHLALWANLGSGLYLLVVGAWLVPALSIPQAVIAALIGAGLGSALVAVAVRLGAAENRPGVVLHRGALGESGAHLYGVLACFRHLAWGALQLAIAAELAAVVMDRQGLGGGRPLWAAIFGALVLLMVLAGPATVTRRWLVPGALLTLLIAVVFTYSAWSDFGVPTMLLREPSGGWPSMTAAVDIVAAVALIWLPVATDLGRLGQPRRAGMAAFAGLAGMTAWFVLLGILFIPAVDGRDLAGFLLATPAGALALLLVIVLELDGAFVSLYGLASTARAWAPKADAALPAVVGGAAVFVLGAALLDPFDYGDALLLLGAAFAPLLGVLLAFRTVRRWWLRASAKTRLLPGGQVEIITRSVSPPTLGGAVAWALGFLLYNWASPLTVPGWTPAMSALFHGLLRLPFPAGVPGLSATVLGFTAAFAISAGATALRAARAGHAVAARNSAPQPAGQR
jgi:NCS1 family nucleobase:cation symporter-1